MKTPEDEAFDELAKRQGAWGGGYQAKRKAAADKINSDFDEEYKKMHEDRIKYGTSWGKDGKRIDPMSVYKEQPAQEPVIESWREFASDYERGFIDGMQKQAQSSVDKAVNRMAQPAQEPVAWLCENAAGHRYFRWKKPSGMYKPIPLYTKEKNT
jgi:hypothetical protein